MKKKFTLLLLLVLLFCSLFAGCTSSIDYQARISGTNELIIEIEHSKDSAQVYEYSMDPSGGLELVSENTSTLNSLFAQLIGRSAKNSYTFRAVSDGTTRLTFTKHHPNTPDLAYTVVNFDVYVEDGKITKFNEVIIMGSN